MSLRSKTLIVTGLTILSLIAILFAISQGIFLNSFSKLEERETEQNVHRAQTALTDRLEGLGNISVSYSAWDDTYAFIQSENEDYIRNNFTENVFVNLQINLIAIAKNNGEIPFLQLFDLQSSQFIPSPTGLQQILVKDNTLLNHKNPDSIDTGIIILPDGPMMVVSSPIVTNSYQGPILGSVIVGRYLDKNELDHLSASIQLSVTVESLDNSNIPDDYLDAYNNIVDISSIYVHPLDDDIVAGYALMKDVWGEPALMLRVEMSRETYKKGQASISYFVLSLLASSLVFGVITLFVLEKFVLTRLARLGKSVSMISASGSTSARVVMGGHDELSSLGSEINKMLDTLQLSDRELRRSEERLKLAIDGANLGLWDLNIQTGKMEFYHHIHKEGGDPNPFNESTSWDTWLEKIHSEDVGKTKETFHKYLNGELPNFEFELRIQSQTGGWTWVLMMGRVVMSDSYGRPLRMAGIYQTINRRKEMETALRESERKLRGIVEQSPDGIILIDEKGEIIQWNHAQEEIIGLHTDKAIGKYIWDVWFGMLPEEVKTPDYFQQIKMQYDKAMRTGQGLFMDNVEEIEFVTYDNRQRVIQTHAFPIETTRGYMIGNIMRDITEQKQVEEDLKRAKEVAETANRAKSTFLANMSHELRTPLNAIIGYSEMLQEEASDMDYKGIIPDLGKIRSAGRHLLELINEILDLSKIESGRMTLYLETFEVNTLIDSITSTSRPLFDKNKNRLDIIVDPSVGTMHADLTKTRQVLFNLMSNAAKFTKEGRVELKVWSEESNGKNRVVFRVSDTGIGINQQELQTIFRAFTQGDSSTTRKYGGTGLGLAISRRFCQMMGGEIIVESKIGQGSTFTVYIPVKVESEEIRLYSSGVEKQPDNKPIIDIEELPEQYIGTALVIDDDPAACDLIKRLVAKEKYRCEITMSGAEGLKKAKQLKPDLILLDVLMPGMNGWQVLTALKADPELAEIPVIMATIVSEKNIGFALGASEYLVKPLDKEYLLSVLQKYQITSRIGRKGNNGIVLVVDDDPLIRQRLHETLSEVGWIVKEAADGLEGLEHVKTETPELILLDLLLPEIDGYQFINQIRQNPNWESIPILVITSKDLTDEEHQYLAGKVEEILQKGNMVLDLESFLSEVRREVAAHTYTRDRKGDKNR